MEVAGKVAVVTGGGAGIGAALANRLAGAGAKVLLADLDGAAAETVAERINAEHPGSAIGVGADVSDDDRIREILARAEADLGPVEIYFANAGIAGASGLDVGEDDWDLSLDVNLRAHIRAAKQLVPRWVERGSGYFVSTASAAVGFAEWLSITYGDRGVRVSCLCPMGVNTKLLRSGEESGDDLGAAATRAVTSAGEVLEPEQVADIVLQAMADERFLVLPHENVLDMYRQKGADYDRWLRGMRRYQASLLAHTDNH